MYSANASNLFCIVTCQAVKKPSRQYARLPTRNWKSERARGREDWKRTYSYSALRPSSFTRILLSNVLRRNPVALLLPEPSEMFRCRFEALFATSEQSVQFASKGGEKRKQRTQ
jgi:hypothetical protein